MIATEPECTRCLHFDRSNKNGFTCAAFPKGIPKLIVTAIVKHHEPYEGDHGIRFEPIDGAGPTPPKTGAA